MVDRVIGRMFRSAIRFDQDDNPVANRIGPDINLKTEEEPRTTHSFGDIEYDNSNQILIKIATLYAEKLMNDICLIVGGIDYPAHRLILCASSEVFQTMLMNPCWPESRKSRVELQETPACCAIFGEFLRYFYTGQIRINHLTIMPILTLADKYNVKDLTNLCIEYMFDHIAFAATNSQLITWFQYTLNLGHYEVARACHNFVKCNLELVSQSNDFGSFQLDLFVKLLQLNELVVHNEMTVYKCVVSWLECQRKIYTDISENELELYMDSLLKEVMRYVRFPMMSPPQLADLLMSPLTNRYKEFFIELMAIGMSFHSGQSEKIAEIASCDTGRLLFTPRLYTADKWCSMLTVENFPSLQAYQTRTLVFSSHSVLTDFYGDKTCEWVVDLYPKGVWFKKYFLIVWHGTIEVPEIILKTVRVSITCKDPPPDCNDLRVKVGILMIGVQDKVEHVRNVVHRNHRFSEHDRVLNLDDIVSFDELVMSGNDSPFLVGPNRDILKIHIVIAPLCEYSCIDPPDLIDRF